jgi:hypothetical protein
MTIELEENLEGNGSVRTEAVSRLLRGETESGQPESRTEFGQNSNPHSVLPLDKPVGF